MSKLKYLKEFDKSQLWRFFVDGRFHKKYDGWVGYEAKERGSIQALINGFSFALRSIFSITHSALASSFKYFAK